MELGALLKRLAILWALIPLNWASFAYASATLPPMTHGKSGHLVVRAHMLFQMGIVVGATFLFMSAVLFFVAVSRPDRFDAATVGCLVAGLFSSIVFNFAAWQT